MRKRVHPFISICIFCWLTMTACGPLRGQTAAKIDVAVLYTTEAAKPVADEGAFWLQGGSAEAGWRLWRGLGVGATLTGSHNGNFGLSGVPLSLFSYTVGPRYRYQLKMKRLPKRLSGSSTFGEFLVGGVHGFDSVFPRAGGETSAANSYQTDIALGLDVKLDQRFDVRAVEIGWVHMGLPNAGSDVQNDLRLSFGLVVKFGKTKPAKDH